MAAKVNISKLLQEIRGFSEVTNRRPDPKLPGLFLMQLRATTLQKAPPKRKLTIAIQMNDHLNVPHPVKIRHMTGSPIPVVVIT
jgi:hypothetical protein